ncbi:unnamed protein product [Moneuplotes crassus]|uniref:USP domain-containing protein n=1 Tax=Euplotes crassus TaxID=5936 RepID=A0AAD1XD53_EUPCR|nr:unnamed protein product [Moneuplotes crassus]
MCLMEKKNQILTCNPLARLDQNKRNYNRCKIMTPKHFKKRSKYLEFECSKENSYDFTMDYEHASNEIGTKRMRKKEKKRDKNKDNECKEIKQMEEDKNKEEHFIFQDKDIISSENDSFFSSILHALLSISDFSEYFQESNKIISGTEKRLNKNYFVEDKNKRQKYSKRLCEFICAYFSDNPSPIKSENLRSLFDGEFPVSQKHKPFKLLKSLLNILQYEHDNSNSAFLFCEYKNIQEAWNIYIKDHNSIVDQLFVGMYETSYKCNECSDRRKVYKEFKFISLKQDPNSKTTSFPDLLCPPSQTPSKILCLVCKTVKNCQVQSKIAKYPKYLLLSLTPPSPTYSSTFTTPTLTYTLITSILTHPAPVAICKRDSHYTLFSNSSSVPVKASEMISSDASVLVYQGEGTEELK